MKYGLEETELEKILSVFDKYAEIQQVILYGSRAKGNIDLFKSGRKIVIICGIKRNRLIREK